jgi:hypothetical protein
VRGDCCRVDLEASTTRNIVEEGRQEGDEGRMARTRLDQRGLSEHARRGRECADGTRRRGAESGEHFWLLVKSEVEGVVGLCS